jgi:hypothetical protein
MNILGVPHNRSVRQEDADRFFGRVDFKSQAIWQKLIVWLWRKQCSGFPD